MIDLRDECAKLCCRAGQLGWLLRKKSDFLNLNRQHTVDKLPCRNRSSFICRYTCKWVQKQIAEALYSSIWYDKITQHTHTHRIMRMMMKLMNEWNRINRDQNSFVSRKFKVFCEATDLATNCWIVKSEEEKQQII